MEKHSFNLNALLVAVVLLMASTLVSGQETISGSFTSNGETRTYTGALPDNPEASLRVVLLFCGITENAAQMELRGFNNFLGNNTMVVYPQPMSVNLGFDNSAGVDDFQMVEDLIAHLAMNYSVNLDDLCVGGFSNGGIFTYNLICDFNGSESTRPYSFKAFAVVSGAMEEGQNISSNCPIANEVPAIVFHGTQDPVIAYGGGTMLPPVSITTADTEATVDFWASQVNGCLENPTISALPNTIEETPNASSVELVEYACTALPNTTLYRINGGRHAWPSGNANIDIAQGRNMDIDASALIAEFFESTTITSIADVGYDTNSISVYPNPVGDVLSIQTNSAIEKIEIFNIAGQQVNVFVNPGFQVALVDLNPGIYFLKIETKKGMDVKKIVKD